VELFKILENENVDVAASGVALPNPGSVALHKKIGIFEEYLIKGTYRISSIWIRKILCK